MLFMVVLLVFYSTWLESVVMAREVGGGRLTFTVTVDFIKKSMYIKKCFWKLKADVLAETFGIQRKVFEIQAHNFRIQRANHNAQGEITAKSG